ncbi:MAG: helix-hairpin-helix domain-containing protein, partial [Bacteroidales bacterium]|nr:helix-hairpin-helix domain-containing protein [Bacteroidales bacterium]
MCRRSGGSVYGTLISILFIFKVSAPAQAQALPESVTALIEQLAEQGSEAEALVRYYEGLLHSPLNLNAASRAQLEETRLFTLFQVESLVAWRERYGGIRSAMELSLVEGFSQEQVAELRPFLDFGDPAPRNVLSQTYTARFRKKWRQEGFSLTTKAVCEKPAWSVGAVVDNDPQERFPDFVSVSGRYKGLYLGDFTARFGQGLVWWQAFPMTVFGAPSGVARRGNGLQEY